MKTPLFKQILPLLLLISILFLCFWLRIAGRETLPAEQFLENDAYLCYWQANTIVEEGKLPPRDMHRWLPLGRDNGLFLSLYSYLLAYTYKAMHLFFKDVSLYHVCIYMPTVCFVLGLGVLCFFLYSMFGAFVANTTGILIATLPATIGRSTVGFGDRDAWCLLLAICAILFYLWALETDKTRNRIVLTFLSGFFTLLGGLSWEGFGVFVLMIYGIEFWRFLTSPVERTTDFCYYLLWVCAFVPLLYLLEPAYRRGIGFAQHIDALMLVPPILLLAIRAIRYQLQTLPQTQELLKKHSRSLALGITLLLFILGIGYIWAQLQNLDSTTPLTQTPLMASVTELNNPDFHFWRSRYGSIFILASIALVAGAYNWKRWILALPLGSFVLATFAREPIAALFGEWIANACFGVALGSCGVGVLYTAYRYHTPSPQQPKLASLCLAAWFLLWVAFSRDAMRYDFFCGIPLAFFSAVAIKTFTEKVEDFLNTSQAGKIVSTATLAIILFWAPVGGPARFSLYAATQMRTAIPGHGILNDTFAWIKTNLKDGVVAAHWRFGSQLNVLADVKTLIDQDHYLPNWIYLYNQHVHHAKTEREALEYLKTHEATHILVTPDDPHDSLLNKNPFGYRGFKPVFPKTDFAASHIKLWEIQYPPDIETDEKYLETAVPKK